MPTLFFKISEAEIEKLNYERYAYPQPMIQKRIFSVYHKTVTNFSNSNIGLITGLHPNIVSYWIGVYKENGFEGQLTTYRTNQSSREEHGESILCSFSHKPSLNVAEAHNASVK